MISGQPVSYYMEYCRMDLTKQFELQVKHLDSASIDALFKQETLKLSEYGAYPGTYTIFRDELNPQKSLIAVCKGLNTWQKKAISRDQASITPKDAGQSAAFDSFHSKAPLNVVTGRAGSGKTTLALAYAYNEFINKNIQQITLIKPTTQVGKSQAFSAVPGDIDEKFAPYLESYKIILKKHFPNQTSYFSANTKGYSEKKQPIKFYPLELLRGCTLDDTVVILDEAQNATWHQLNTLISRIGENAKLILVGDIHQSDLFDDITKSGLYQLLQAKPFLESDLKTVVQLNKTYRSPIVDLVYQINQCITNTK